MCAALYKHGCWRCKKGNVYSYIYLPVVLLALLADKLSYALLN